MSSDVQELVDRTAEGALVLEQDRPQAVEVARRRAPRSRAATGRRWFCAGAGGARPVSRSRTIMATASSMRRVGAIGDLGVGCRGGSGPRAWRRGCPRRRPCGCAPIDSTRTCSTASKTARAAWASGRRGDGGRPSRGRRAAAPSSRRGRARWRPRAGVSLRGGSGRRALAVSPEPTSAGTCSAA